MRCKDIQNIPLMCIFGLIQTLVVSGALGREKWLEAPQKKAGGSAGPHDYWRCCGRLTSIVDVSVRIPGAAPRGKASAGRVEEREALLWPEPVEWDASDFTA
ncbi:hypothetical protein CC78DRAFT_573211 [Lojkania enalia]|uniref:Uncharacterized protein n=1 Tax=Lojkania enalia TaxID=147567 RepID=A0A9P4NCZ6_9PLEO|nr:hypothetical protein CC78DRAFT_573211 [Didymosphaeria enalia]